MTTPTKTPPSLREQMIKALDDNNSAYPHVHNARLFDEAIMPILQKAMDAGQLMLSRNTGERVPVPDALNNWIDGMVVLANQVKANEHTVSKRTLLGMIESLGASAARARADIDPPILNNISRH